MIAQERRDFDAAASWYQKSLEIKERQGDDYGAAITYHQLGMIAEERQDFDAAESWYEKSLEIAERQGDEHGAALTYGQLGIIAGLQGDFLESGRWLLKCVTIFAGVNDPHGAQRNARNFLITLQNASEEDQATLRKMWEEAGLPPLSEAEEAA